jgi:heme exporter protein CcmD
VKYAFYIYAAWGIGLATLLAVTAYTCLESFRLKKELKRLETSGIRRRSAAPATETKAAGEPK